MFQIFCVLHSAFVVMIIGLGAFAKFFLLIMTMMKESCATRAYVVVVVTVSLA